MIKLIKNKQDLIEYLKSLEIDENTIKIELNVKLIEGKYDAPAYTIPYIIRPEYSSIEIEGRANSLDLSLRRGA